MVSVYSLLLFCGDCLSVRLEKGVFVVSIDDGWIRFAASSHEVLNLINFNKFRKLYLIIFSQNPVSENFNEPAIFGRGCC